MLVAFKLNWFRMVDDVEAVEVCDWFRVRVCF